MKNLQEQTEGKAPKRPLRSKTSTWFECKIRYERTMDDGLQKKVTEPYLVDAMSFTEAEQRIIEETNHFISGDFEVKDIKRCNFSEVVFDDNSNADRWFKAKLQFISINEKTQKEKRTNFIYLVNAANIDAAWRNINEVMGKTMIDYDIASVAETAIMDVFEHNKI